LAQLSARLRPVAAPAPSTRPSSTTQPVPQPVSPGVGRPANWNTMTAAEQAQWLCRDDPTRFADRCGTPSSAFDPDEVTVSLFGDFGTRFRGSCKAVFDGRTETRNFSDTLPAGYKFRATALACEFAKQSGSHGVFHVQFIRNSRSIKDSGTRDPFGRIVLSFGKID
jgi:hypothetical protein